ncbi:MAG: hypothetical protein C0404_04540 [Verrucomicrobia bacterium]|nr:hypothetical protein [Verrucomicrobiota bacterium]
MINSSLDSCNMQDVFPGRFLVLLALASVLCGAGEVSAVATKDSRPMLVTSYYRYLMGNELEGYCKEVMAKADDGQKKEIGEALAETKQACFLRIKKDLQGEFGDRAQEEFTSFISAYTSAEKEGNKEYLKEMGNALAVAPAPGSYDALRGSVTAKLMKGDVDSLAGFLSDAEVWVQLKKKEKNTVPFKAWLSRQAAPAVKPVPVQPVKKTDPLRDAEVPVPALKDEEVGDVNPVDAFGEMRKARRQRAMEESKAGMQQVAKEREAAERDEAARKQEAASAEAEALKAQANKIAAVEKEAIEQSKDTWGARLNNIIGSTVSAAGGAFFGGIGARAGQEAVRAIFDKK